MLALRARDAGVDLLGLSGQQLRLRGDDVRFGGRARVILILGDFERALILFDRIGVKLLRRIRRTQLDIGERQRRLRRERRVGQIRGAGLRGVALLLYRAAHLAPDIQGPACASLRQKQVGSRT